MSRVSKRSHVWMQLLINFVLPLVVLQKFSSPDRLGPTGAFLVALVFPLGFELYRWLNKQKTSIVSLVAIGGILLTGLVGLLGLSEQWLAVRRSITYAAIGFVLYGLAMMRHPIIETFMPKLFHMDLVLKAAKQKNTQKELMNRTHLVGKLFGVLLLATAALSYVTTRIIISAQPNSVAYTQEYARLRVISLATVSLPLMLGTIGLIALLVTTVERLTSLPIEKILKKQ